MVFTNIGFPLRGRGKRHVYYLEQAKPMMLMMDRPLNVVYSHLSRMIGLMALIDIEDPLLVQYCKEVLFIGVQYVDGDQKAVLHTKLDQRHLLIESDRGINLADIGGDSLG